eukprot:CAMPEP_0197681426 /NCGR_PEP_ID=MMETSP1338-20131121/94924_1 /TAXON_ID=43686 ORGANISM="Pelagodinium beii, Strain RCC1491" /NCGR_SAMPLE_ID=MMETSP1338 /ASSEMBLY_ACC=CAM_ASM_000754 /LENGTH=242 /DNA_ID=CAMNT_0043262769 /DNA_START=18 /DNA_END=746 /DNA_ORIENTATION=+
MTDRVELALCNKTLRLNSAVFGFPEFESLVELIGNGSARFYAGMISKGLGSWSVSPGKTDEYENPEDVYLDLVQPLPSTYKEEFVVPSDICYWRGRLCLTREELDNKALKIRKVKVDSGTVTATYPRAGISGQLIDAALKVLPTDVGEKIEEWDDRIVREGVFTAQLVGEKGIAQTVKKARDEFERALTTPRAESTGFKTPARIAGAKRARPSKQLGAGATPSLEEGDLDLIEDGPTGKNTG